jgi:hypothetical protein
MMSEAEEIRDEIRNAFAGVMLGDGISLEQTKIIDDYGRGCSAEEFAALPLKEVTDDWTKIPDAVLDEAECLAHLDSAGFQYYIPALMIRLLDNYDSGSMMSIGTLSGLSANSPYYLERYSELSASQQHAIARYVKALPTLVDLDTEDRTELKRAFEIYWSKFEIYWPKFFVDSE